MENVNALFTVNWATVIVGVLLILVCGKFVWELMDWFINKLGIETKASRTKKEDHELLLQTVSDLTQLQKARDKSDEVMSQQDKEIKNQLEQVINCVKEMSTQIKEINERSIAAEVASRESLGDMINQRYRHYIEIQGIPEDELQSFVDLHDAYNGVKGNHSGDAKFNFCMKQLPILPPSANLSVTSGDDK